MSKKVVGWILSLAGLVALGVLWVGIQGYTCPDVIYTGVEAYLLNAREIRIEGNQQELSSHQITLTTAGTNSVPWEFEGSTESKYPELNIIIRDADGALLGIGSGRR